MKEFMEKHGMKVNGCTPHEDKKTLIYDVEYRKKGFYFYMINDGVWAILKKSKVPMSTWERLVTSIFHKTDIGRNLSIEEALTRMNGMTIWN